MKVSELWIYPVQSMRGQPMEALDFGRDGIRLDRWFGIRDVETGKMVGSSSAKKAWRPIITWDVRLLTPVDAANPKVEIRFPDGARVASDDPNIAALLSDRLGRAVEFKGGDGEPAPRRYALAHCHLLTSATLKRLKASHPDGDFAVERFRPNMVVDCGDAVGFVEQPWLGRRIAAASGAVLEGSEDASAVL